MLTSPRRAVTSPEPPIQRRRDEARAEMLDLEGRLPNLLRVSVGGGANAIGLFHPFLNDVDVKMIGIEAAEHGIHTDKHAANINGGQPGMLHRKPYLWATGRRWPHHEPTFNLSRPRLSRHRP